jgi:hypothetical protein
MYERAPAGSVPCANSRETMRELYPEGQKRILS